MRPMWSGSGPAVVFVALLAISSSARAAAQEGSSAGSAYEPVTVAGGGSVSGVVRLPGPAPRVQELRVTKDESVCGAWILSERIVRAAEGGLKNAVVSIEGISRGKPIDAGRTGRLDCQRCRYEPHVLALAVGQRLEMTNSDPILHNPHAKLSGVLSVFNIALPHQNQKVPKVLKEPGLLKVTCDDGHVWMEAYVHAFPHPYFAVTDEAGRFAIDGIPPGTYTLRAWQEVLGTQSIGVTILEGQEAKVTFENLSTK